MNELINVNVELTSLDIAEVTGKEHKNILVDIRKEFNELGNEIGQLIFQPSTYLNKQNKEQPLYKLGKDGAMQLALKYDAKTRYLVIKKIEELESRANTPSYMIEDPVDRAEKWIEEQKKVKLLSENIEKKDQIIGELKPKADYVDTILNSKSLLTITQIAKDYGMSGVEMNKLLNKLGIQYKQSDQWLLYAQYHGKGYTHSETFDIELSNGTTKTKMNTKWLQKGRLFLYEKLKENDVIPTIER